MVGRQPSRDRLEVRTLRCGCNNPGSSPGHGTFLFHFFEARGVFLTKLIYVHIPFFLKPEVFFHKAYVHVPFLFPLLKPVVFFSHMYIPFNVLTATVSM